MMNPDKYPALWFVVRFGLFYLVFSLGYSIYLSAYEGVPDPITYSVALQVAEIQQVFDSRAVDLVVERDALTIRLAGVPAVSVFEGCNGFIVAGLFLSFFVAFWKWTKRTFGYILIGLLSIHLLNLIRLVLLLNIALENATLFYYYHKYAFTAIMYTCVFLIWLFWLKSTANPGSHVKEQAV